MYVIPIVAFRRIEYGVYMIWYRLDNLCTVEPLLTDTSLIRTPPDYGPFPWSRQNAQSYILYKENLYNTEPL